MNIELNEQELYDLIEGLQELINAERIGVQALESCPSDFDPVPFVDQSIDRFTELQAKLEKQLEKLIRGRHR